MEAAAKVDEEEDATAPAGGSPRRPAWGSPGGSPRRRGWGSPPRSPPRSPARRSQATAETKAQSTTTNPNTMTTTTARWREIYKSVADPDGAWQEPAPAGERSGGGGGGGSGGRGLSSRDVSAVSRGGSSYGSRGGGGGGSSYVVPPPSSKPSSARRPQQQHLGHARPRAHPPPDRACPMTLSAPEAARMQELISHSRRSDDGAPGLPPFTLASLRQLEVAHPSLKAQYAVLQRVGPGEYRPPRHQTYFEPSLLELFDILCRGEQYLRPFGGATSFTPFSNPLVLTYLASRLGWNICLALAAGATRRRPAALGRVPGGGGRGGRG